MRSPEERSDRGTSIRFSHSFVLLSILFAALFFAASASGQQPTPAPLIAIKAGRLIDVEAAKVLPNQVILIEGTRIKALGENLAIPASAAVIDLSKKTVLPGLIDCHTHIADIGDPEPLNVLQKTAAEAAFASIPHARATLLAGFTTVRDVGTYRAFVDVALRDAINRGDVVGPRMFVAGAYITITGGAGALNGPAPDITLPWDLRFGTADGPDQVRQRVRAIAQYGADVIKVLATGAFLTHQSNPGADEFTYDELRAAVEEASKRGLRVAAHAHAASGIKNAVRAGVASIEHGTMLDDEGIALMKQRGTYLVADIYNEDWIRGEGAKRFPADFLAKSVQSGELQRETFRKAVQAGVKIAYGTDAGVYPHGYNARQFAYQVKYGQTPMQTIQSATIHAAELIGKPQEFGSIRPGKFADIIAVSGDPLADIRVLENVSFVMKEGKVFKQEP